MRPETEEHSKSVGLSGPFSSSAACGLAPLPPKNLMTSPVQSGHGEA